MPTIALFKKADPASILGRRGHHVVYRADETNRCPGCGRSNWYIGRTTAECGFCGTAITLAEVNIAPTRTRVSGDRPAEAEFEAAVDERRRYRRRPAAGVSLELLLDGSPQSFALEDLSAGGLKALDPIGLTTGTKLHVRFDEGVLVPAAVRWSEDGLIGLTFAWPIGGHLLSDKAH